MNALEFALEKSMVLLQFNELPMTDENFCGFDYGKRVEKTR